MELKTTSQAKIEYLMKVQYPLSLTKMYERDVHTNLITLFRISGVHYLQIIFSICYFNRYNFQLKKKRQNPSFRNPTTTMGRATFTPCLILTDSRTQIRQSKVKSAS